MPKRAAVTDVLLRGSDRAVAHIEGHRSQLLPRRENVYKSWPHLCEELAHAVRCDDAVIDGEIVCLRPDGRSDFCSLMFRRDWPYFMAFDLLSLNGRDIRQRVWANASVYSRHHAAR